MRRPTAPASHANRRAGVAVAALAMLVAVGANVATTAQGASASPDAEAVAVQTVPPAVPAPHATVLRPTATPAANADATATTSATSDPTPAAGASSATSPPAAASPSTSPSVPPKPVDPLAGLSKKERKAFGGCLKRTVGPHSSGGCATLALSSLKKAGYYPWSNVGTITVAGVNALLNYQRSRGLTATGTTTKATWIALATKAHAVPIALPKTCFTKGVVLCVDQAHRKLFWLRDGKVVRTFAVRLGGYNASPKTHKWRIFPTANGTWKVYDKQVDPASDNYGSGAMPYSTMFYPDMYVHYSPGFHSVGYSMSSHGCVNIGQLSQAQWIFTHTPIGAKVHIFSPKATA